MIKTKKAVTSIAILLFLASLSLIPADLVSVNSGGSNQTAITPNKYIEGFFLGSPKEQKSNDDDDGGGSSGGGGGGPDPDPEKKDNKSFSLNPSNINVEMKLNETRERCFTATNEEDEAIFGINTSVSGTIKPLTNLDTETVNLLAKKSESICLDFSTKEEPNTGKYSGKIKLSKNVTKESDIKLQVKENKTKKTNETLEKKEKELDYDGDYEGENNETENRFERGINDLKDTIPDDLKDIKTLILWIPLLIGVIIFLIMKKYSQFISDISGQRSREEKMARLEKMKRKANSSETNFFERIIDKAAIKIVRATKNFQKTSKQIQKGSIK